MVVALACYLSQTSDMPEDKVLFQKFDENEADLSEMVSMVREDKTAVITSLSTPEKTKLPAQRLKKYKALMSKCGIEAIFGSDPLEVYLSVMFATTPGKKRGLEKGYLCARRFPTSSRLLNQLNDYTPQYSYSRMGIRDVCEREDGVWFIYLRPYAR